MTKSEIETAKRELDHALGAFEEWAAGSMGWGKAAHLVLFGLMGRHPLAADAFRAAALALAQQSRIALKAVDGRLAMRRLAPVFLDLIIEQAE